MKDQIQIDIENFLRGKSPQRVREIGKALGFRQYTQEYQMMSGVLANMVKDSKSQVKRYAVGWYFLASVEEAPKSANMLQTEAQRDCTEHVLVQALWGVREQMGSLEDIRELEDAGKKYLRAAGIKHDTSPERSRKTTIGILKDLHNLYITSKRKATG